ncbi:MAG: FlgD immunoglobulin-like domain containing protein [bacterium]
MRSALPWTTAALLALFTSASAQTVTVTIATDDVDIDWQTATIADLPGPDGEVSFSEALIATDNTPGHQTIAFAIPQSEWQLQFLYPGRAVLRTITGFFWRANDEVTIDGTTQTAFTGDTNPDGCEIAVYGGEIYVNGHNSVFTGFDSTPVTITGANGTVTGNTGTTNITVWGSGNLIQGNHGGTIKIDRANDNVVIGNTVNRVRVLGGGSTQLAMNNRVGGPDPSDRNWIVGYGTINGEGLPAGATIQLSWAGSTLIQNNWIGTTPDGLSQGSLASTAGVSLETENWDTVIRDNRIAGILGHGQGPHHAGQLFGSAIQVYGTGSGLTIENNTIGLNANDEPLLGSVNGVDLGYFGNMTLTDISILNNEIAGHLLRGVIIGPNVPQVRIQATAIHSNGDLGIDLVDPSYNLGVSANDVLDADAGANGLQNYPVLAAAETDGVNVLVTGVLQSSPLDEFGLDFFASPTCDASGFGEGQIWLGATTVFTDAAGDADFSVTLPGAVAEGWVVTATATREPIGATSEFSACQVVTTVGPITDVAVVDPASLDARLLPGFPNPFRDHTTIRYELPRAARVELAVYDVAGRRVRVLDEGERAAGPHRTEWDGLDQSGRPVAGGVYFSRLKSGGSTSTSRVILTR